MKILKNQLVFEVEALKECVKNIKETRVLIKCPLIKEDIGYITNFKYTKAKVVADFHLFSNKEDIEWKNYTI